MLKSQTKTFFKTVVESGGLFNSKHLSLKAVSKETLMPEVKIIISKKVVSSAVDRNHLRRRVRGIFNNAGGNHMWAIFYAKKGSGGLSFKDLQSEVKYLIKKLNSKNDKRL